MRAQITVNMDNAAFEDNEGPELARILEELARRVQDCAHLSLVLDCGKLRDLNGNAVGQFTITEEAEE